MIIMEGTITYSKDAIEEVDIVFSSSHITKARKDLQEKNFKGIFNYLYKVVNLPIEGITNKEFLEFFEELTKSIPENFHIYEEDDHVTLSKLFGLIPIYYFGTEDTNTVNPLLHALKTPLKSRINLYRMVNIAHNTARENGWHDGSFSDEHWVSLIITELSEAVEAERTRKPEPESHLYSYMRETTFLNDFSFKKIFDWRMKDTVTDELADTIIRIFDFVGLRSYSLFLTSPMTTFTTVCLDEQEPLKPLTEHVPSIIGDLIDFLRVPFEGANDEEINKYFAMKTEYLSSALSKVFRLGIERNANFVEHVWLKMQYNTLRGHKHGGKLY